MKERKEIDKIRELLGRWYSGEAAPSEEEQLREMLLSESDLPDDLKSDRELLSAIADSKSTLPEIPLEYSRRINAALEAEMGGSPIGQHRFFNRRLWMRSASGIAACVAVAFAAHQLWTAPDMALEQGDVKVAMNLSQPVESYDSLPMMSLTLPSAETVKNTGSTAISKKGRNVRKAPKKQPRTGVEEEGDDYDPEYLYDAEEERLARSNYRVVRDAAEADDLLNSIFSRMENTIAMESSRISRIELEYDAEMSRLTQIDNIVEPYTEQHNDATPL